MDGHGNYNSIMHIKIEMNHGWRLRCFDLLRVSLRAFGFAERVWFYRACLVLPSVFGFAVSPSVFGFSVRVLFRRVRFVS